MAIAISKPVAAISTTTDAATFTTASFTPSADAVLLTTHRVSGAVFLTHTISGGGLSWTSLGINPSGSTSNEIWWAVTGSSPSAMTITYTTNGGNATGCLLSVLQFTGANTSSPIRQSKAASLNAANPTITFDSATLTTNGYMGSVGTASTNVITQPTGWTEADELSAITPASRLEIAYRAEGETSATKTWTMTSAAHILLAAEISAVVALSNKIKSINQAVNRASTY